MGNVLDFGYEIRRAFLFKTDADEHGRKMQWTVYDARWPYIVAEILVLIARFWNFVTPGEDKFT